MNRASAQTLDVYLNRLMETGLSPCFSVKMMRGGKECYSFLGGRETPAADARPLTAETRLNIASSTKPVTAALALSLVERGLLALGDPVRRYIPEYPFDSVTVFQLMTHTAGYDETFIIPWPRTRAERAAFYQRIYAVDKLKYAPGEKAAYWTFGYAILADILQRVAGCELEALAREVLFQPLGMAHSTFELSTLRPREYILPWFERENRSFPEACVPVATGDSGLYTTADDLIRFAQMLLDDGMWEGVRVFSSMAARLMLRESTDGKFMRSPGLWIKGAGDPMGCFGDLNSPLAAAHTGMTGCMLLIDPPVQATVVILTNSLRLHEDWRNYQRILNALLAASEA